ncbi:MAG: Hpt domain-containing protein [Desulfobulbus sp.]|jgi:HPt (histidine-containing phosphotransfer) domain-containing protein|uniref:Hpt domain-containing protein n=1 Tax=Desulfobulbus sp. TaxID=895 RepID=UPI002840D168|nr:Hpt domain-containing protein [Desulfobulbus sp.]MDR2550286.1 Hpt domain-containing protein [Desulfobulbus sp.]
MDRAAYLHLIKQHLKTYYLLNDEKIETMIPVFAATLRSHMARLAELAADGNMEQLGKASHAVKGALLNMGLADLAETARLIELRCKNGDRTADYRSLISQLHSTVFRLSEDW